MLYNPLWWRKDKKQNRWQSKSPCHLLSLIFVYLWSYAARIYIRIVNDSFIVQVLLATFLVAWISYAVWVLPCRRSGPAFSFKLYAQEQAEKTKNLTKILPPFVAVADCTYIIAENRIKFNILSKKRRWGLWNLADFLFLSRTKEKNWEWASVI